MAEKRRRYVSERVCQLHRLAVEPPCGDQTNDHTVTSAIGVTRVGFARTTSARWAFRGEQTDDPPCNLPNTCNGAGSCQDGSGNGSLNYDPPSTPCNDRTDDHCKDHLALRRERHESGVARLSVHAVSSEENLSGDESFRPEPKV